MSDKFQNKYRIPSARAEWWDYGRNAAYFVTICTAHRECFFGKIIPVETGQCPVFLENGEETMQCPVSDDFFVKNGEETGQCPVSTNVMQLSEIGRLADKFWWSIPEHFPFVKLDAFVVMPNHIHGILIIDKADDGHDDYGIDVETGHCPVSNERTGDDLKTGQCPVSTNATNNATNAIEPKTPGELRFRNQGKETLSSIIGSYKSIVTKHAHPIRADFEWQERFHDHIIRDQDEYYRITTYIENNVANWQDDKFYNL